MWPRKSYFSFANGFVEHPPHSTQIHLRAGDNWTKLYQGMCNWLVAEKRIARDKVPSWSYFVKIVRERYRFLKKRKNPGMGICRLCAKYTRLFVNAKTPEQRKEVRVLHQSHHDEHTLARWYHVCLPLSFQVVDSIFRAVNTLEEEFSLAIQLKEWSGSTKMLKSCGATFGCFVGSL